MKRRFAALAFGLICVHLCSSVANSSAADAKQLSLRWLGQSFFVLTTSAGTRVAFDPHALPEFGRPKAEADVVLISHPHPDHTRVEAITNREKAKIIAMKPGGLAPGKHVIEFAVRMRISYLPMVPTTTDTKELLLAA